MGGPGLADEAQDDDDRDPALGAVGGKVEAAAVPGVGPLHDPAAGVVDRDGLALGLDLALAAEFVEEVATVHRPTEAGALQPRENLRLLCRELLVGYNAGISQFAEPLQLLYRIRVRSGPF